MFKKTLISLAVASSLGLTGCLSGADEGGNANPDSEITQDKNRTEFLAQFEGKTWPVFDPFPAVSDLPIPNDLIFDTDAGDGSFKVPDSQPPVTTALNQLSGASTIAPIDLKFSGAISNVIGPRELTDPKALLQNVFLIELDYASGDPLRGLSAGEVPAGEPFNDFTTEVRELKGETYLRILPLKPLEANSRYVVVLTNEIKDSAGEAIVSSPAYTELKDESQVIGPGVDRVRTLINDFWEETASQAVNTPAFPLGPDGELLSLNSLRAGKELPELGKENFALSYSFTTSNDKQVLNYIANPANWLRDQIRLSVTTSAVSGVTKAFEGTKAEPTADNFQAAVGGALEEFMPSEAFADTLFESALETNCDPFPVEFKFQCVGNVFYGGLSQQLDSKFPAPAPRDFDLLTTNDAAQVSAVLSTVLSDPTDDTVPTTEIVDVHQGYIDLPYFLNTPQPQSDGTEIQARGWKADTQLASALAKATGFSIPQASASRSTVLNSVFPFPEESEIVRSPLLVMTPAGVGLDDLKAEANDYNAVIFQHGITTDRSAALAFGSALIKNDPDSNTVVFAIDQPLHGVAPSSTEERAELAETLLAGADLIDDNTPDAAVSGLVSQVVTGSFIAETIIPKIIAGGCTDAATAENPGKFILDGNCGPDTDAAAAAAKQLGQSVVLQQTVANAGSTIPGLSPVSGEIQERHFNFGTDSNNKTVVMNFDPEQAVGKSGDLFINLNNFTNSRDNLRQGAIDLMNLRATLSSLGGVEDVYLVGHSLGTVNGAAFVAAANNSGRDDLAIKGTHLMAPASGIVRMLENSPSFAPRILGGLAQETNGTVVQGTAGLEAFLNVFQAAIDSVDPINFADELMDSGVLISQIDGDRTTVNAAFVEDNPPLELDLTVLGVDLSIASRNAPLAGSEPFAMALEAKQTNDTGVLTPAITRYTQGVHSTPVLPKEDIAEAPDAETGDFTVLKNREIFLDLPGQEAKIVSAQNAKFVFAELVAQTLALIEAEGSGVSLMRDFAPLVTAPDPG